MTPEQGSQDWLEWRKTKIGASDAPIIMGACPFNNTPYKLWQQKMGLIPDTLKTSAMIRGNDLEEMVRVRYNQENDTCMEKAVLESSFYSWMIASLDGWDGENAIEIKVSAHTYQQVYKGVVPENYFWQLQHQMFVAGIPHVTLVVYHPEKDQMISIVVKRDEDAIGKMLEKEMAFIQCLRSGEAPDLMDKDYKYMGDDEYFIGLEKIYMDALNQKKEAEEIIESCKERMIKTAGRSSIGHFFKLVQYFRKGPIDYGKIPELESIDLEIYRKKASEVWQLKKIMNEQ